MVAIDTAADTTSSRHTGSIDRPFSTTGVHKVCGGNQLSEGQRTGGSGGGASVLCLLGFSELFMSSLTCYHAELLTDCTKCQEVGISIFTP